jgi:ubiquinone/menaquinone biosynthesis C-methylase UbiE
MQWGDPEKNPALVRIRKHFISPYVTTESTVVEIGPGGGRWTRYLLKAEKLYVVDFYQDLLDELRSNFNQGNMEFVKNNGTDFPGIAGGSVDFVFSYGTFVHLDLDLIDSYLRNIKRLLKPRACVLIQYSDKTKPLGKSNSGFSENDPETMRKLVTSHGYVIYKEDTEYAANASLIQFGL